MPVSLSYLAAHLRNLESLLQTYRQINLTFQSVLLVLGTFLMTRLLETESLQTMLFFGVLLVSLTIFSNVVIWRFKQVIEARGQDVNWWEREIIKAEQNLPPEERRFTNFKIHQSAHWLPPEEAARFLEPDYHASWEEIQQLIVAENEQIRRVINSYILSGMQVLWGVILLISAAVVIEQIITMP